MQKLEERNTYTPTDIPHVRGNCDPVLNVEETLSVQGLKTSSNNSDAALTGLGSSRTELDSICHKNFPLLIANTIAGIVNPATTNARGQIPPLLESRGLLYPLTPRK